MSPGMPPVVVLAGIILNVNFTMSHSVVAVEGTDWIEPVLVEFPFVCQSAVASHPCASTCES